MLILFFFLFTVSYYLFHICEWQQQQYKYRLKISTTEILIGNIYTYIYLFTHVCICIYVCKQTVEICAIYYFVFFSLSFFLSLIHFYRFVSFLFRIYTHIFCEYIFNIWQEITLSMKIWNLNKQWLFYFHFKCHFYDKAEISDHSYAISIESLYSFYCNKNYILL